MTIVGRIGDESCVREREKMTLRTLRKLRKFSPFYSRVPATEGSDSDGAMRSGAPSRFSFTWFQRAFSNGSTYGRVPLSESPKRELRMRSETKARRHQDHSKTRKKRYSRVWW